MKTEYDAQKLVSIAHEVHALAVDRGWWDNPDGLSDLELTGEKCLMIITEVAEAVDCYRKGNMDTYTGPLTPKPEGFQIEVADIAIRSMDLIVRLESTRKKNSWNGGFSWRPASEHTLSALLSVACQEALDVCPVNVLSTCVAISNKFNFDLLEAIRIKHEFNKTRSYRHGGKKI